MCACVYVCMYIYIYVCGGGEGHVWYMYSAFATEGLAVRLSRLAGHFLHVRNRVSTTNTNIYTYIYVHARRQATKVISCTCKTRVSAEKIHKYIHTHAGRPLLCENSS